MASGRPVEKIASALLILLALFVAWWDIRMQLARQAMRNGAIATAGDYAPRLGAVHSARATQALLEGRSDGARAEAVKALSVGLLDADALRAYVFATEPAALNGDPAPLLPILRTYGWRDSPSQIVLAHADLAQGRIATAAMRYDVAMRATDGIPLVARALDRELSDARFAIALAKRFRPPPKWAADYLAQALAFGPRAISARETLLRVAFARGLPPMSTAPFLRARIDRGDVAGARALFYATIARGVAESPLYDPDFTRSPPRNAAPFEWTLLDGPSATAQFAVDANGTRVLAIRGNSSATQPLARQLVLLTPGAHRLEALAQLDTPGTVPIAWQVRCLGAGIALPLVPTTFTRGSTTGIAADFTTPGAGCAATVELVLTAQESPSDFEAAVRSVSLR